MKTSVIITAYKGAHLLGRAIESVLVQTHDDFELIVVDDASPDQTADVVRRYPDPRVRYIRHDTNRGANQAWVTGLDAARGDLIACLDQDDWFHPDKLRQHIAVYRRDPNVGVTYNARFELKPGSENIREIWLPPAHMSLADVVTGFPFAPTDMVMRRDWAQLEGLWDDTFAPPGEEVIVNGSEIIYCGLLHLSGCRFARIPRALNYRRRYAERKLSDIEARCLSELRCQEAILNDRRCPADIRAHAGRAFATTYVSWAVVAFAQQRAALAADFLKNAVRYDAALLAGRPAPLVTALMWAAVAGDSADHEVLVDRFFEHLPADLSSIAEQCEWAKFTGSLVRGVRSLMWDSLSEAAAAFERAAALQGVADEWFLRTASHQLLVFEAEQGTEAASRVKAELVGHLERVGTSKSLRWWKGHCAINSAFRNYYAGNTASVASQIWEAVVNEPQYLRNRGVWAMLARACIGLAPDHELSPRD
jgi:hypothetical protein